MPLKYFDFRGCVVEFSADAPALEESAGFDFSAFACPPAAPLVRLKASLGAVNPASLPPSRFTTRRWSVLEAPAGRRLVWYPEGALVDYDFTERSGSVTAADPALLRELSYLLVLSRAGEELDRMGLHRVHAGALAWRGGALLLCGARGAGKTTLLMELLKDTEFSLLSDDTPLAGPGGTIHPFPVRIGLGLDSPHLGDFGGLRDFTRRGYPPKRLLDPVAAGCRLSPPLPARHLFLLRRGAAPGIAAAPPGAGAAELAVSLAAGYGTPQLAEYFLRLTPGDMAAKGGILFSRLRACLALLRRCGVSVFTLSPDRAANAAALRDFLRSGSAAA